MSKLNKQFISEITVLANQHNCIKLILDSIKQKIILQPKIHQKNNYYIVTLHGINDVKLARFGKLYGFPRGFHIIWYPKQSIQFYGFYPKFENDDMNSLIETDDVMLVGNKKFSGSLGIVVAINDHEWIVLAKNSIDNIYTEQMRSLLENDIKPELIKYMYENHINFCCECMLPNDKTHGSNHNPGYVVTCVARSQKITYDSKIEGYIPNITSKNQFLEYYNNYKIIEFAKCHNLSVSDLFEIDHNENIIKLINILTKERNIITCDRVDEVLHECNCNIIQGTIKHQNLCGNILEGLVLKITDTNQITRMIKFKFARYTIRTMFLREYVVTLTSNNDIREINEDDRNIFLQKYFEWAKRWLLHDQYKSYWNVIILDVFNNFNKYLSEWKCIAFDLKQPRLHIYIMDNVCAKIPYDKTIDYSAGNIINLLNCQSDSSATIILIMGAIGTGKSTYGNELSKKIIQNSVHIDSDKFLSEEIVMSMGAERNPFTQFIIYKHLFNSKTIIISTGGGTLLTSQKCQKFRTIFDDLKCKVIITVIIPTITDKIIIDKQFIESSLYDDDHLKQVLIQRNMINLFDKLKENNKKNIDIQRNMINKLKELDMLENIIYVPFIDSTNFHIVNDICKKIKITQQTTNIDASKFKFIQHRLLASCSNPKIIHHITWEYDDEGIHYVDNHIKMFQTTATYLNLGKCSLLIVDMPEQLKKLQPYAHITVNAGPHNPANMKDIAIAYRKNEKSITISTRDGKQNKTYELDKIIKVQTTVTIYDEFYMNY